MVGEGNRKRGKAGGIATREGTEVIRQSFGPRSIDTLEGGVLLTNGPAKAGDRLARCGCVLEGGKDRV